MTNNNVMIDIIQSGPIIRQEPLRSKIVIKPHVRLILLNEIYQIESKALDVDPFTYLGAIVDNDANHWKKNMKQ